MKKRKCLLMFTMVMVLLAMACGKDEAKQTESLSDAQIQVEKTVEEQEEIVQEVVDETKNVSMDESIGESEEVPEVEDSDEEEVAETVGSQDAIDPHFKEAMDSYEAFFDEYVDFMKKYMDAGAEDMVAMMGDYTDYMTKYAETMKKLEALEEEEMTVAEAAYYTEVTGRITKKLLEVQ